MTAPIFKNIFGDKWQSLPPVMQKHYAVRTGTADVVTVEGVMDIETSRIAKIMTPFFRLAGTLTPYAGKDIPVTVRFSAGGDGADFRFDRTFRFPGRAPYHFKSRMRGIGGNEVVEFMRFGLGWRAAYSWDGQRVTMTHRGYVWRVFGLLVPLPLTILMGRGDAWETPLDDDRFSMRMEIKHPLWGQVYAYGGIFGVTAVQS